MRTITSIILLGCLFFSCAQDEIPTNPNDTRVEILLSVSHYTKSGAAMDGKIDQGTPEERKIRNIYLFLFSDTKPLQTYFISGSIFKGGTWSESDEKIGLDLTPEMVGKRMVYMVANCDAVKERLAAVKTPADLEKIMVASATPWSPQLATPLLMVGSYEHDFSLQYQLKHIALERAVAKLKIAVTLPAAQLPVEGAYKYRFVNFNPNTTLLREEGEPANLTYSEWFSVTPENGIFSIETYLNENKAVGDENRTRVEILLPEETGGLLPPPEFGDEIYRLLLPEQVERNTLYQYAISFDN